MSHKLHLNCFSFSLDTDLPLLHFLIRTKVWCLEGSAHVTLLSRQVEKVSKIVLLVQRKLQAYANLLLTLGKAED